MDPGHVWVEGPGFGETLCRNCLQPRSFGSKICPAACELTGEAWD